VPVSGNEKGSAKKTDGNKKHNFWHAKLALIQFSNVAPLPANMAYERFRFASLPLRRAKSPSPVWLSCLHGKEFFGDFYSLVI